ncbi:MAG: DUF3379 family protein [Betaproteobacteria bacterium]|nr:DUF3379 family protein [Betaproteobacteria bacterium]
MNVKQASRALLADPRRSDPELEHAIATNPALHELRLALKHNGATLAAAFAEVSPPPGLADRIILRARFRQRTRWLAGIAAGALVATAALFALRPEAPAPIAVAMLDHVITQPDELADAGSVPAQTARASLQRIGIRFDDLGYPIRHLTECVIDGRTGRHLVVKTPEGLVTLLVVPRRSGEMPGRIELKHADFRAVLRPAGSVAVGVFADRRLKPEAMDALMQKMFTGTAGQA